MGIGDACRITIIGNIIDRSVYIPDFIYDKIVFRQTISWLNDIVEISEFIGRIRVNIIVSYIAIIGTEPDNVTILEGLGEVVQ